MQITFIGATHEVTGSCTLIELNNRYYLVDCGMEQGANIFENVPIPVPAEKIEAVFLTHAHIDHSGMLPKLCRDGFRGAIYSTDATANLCNVMLQDSAHIQESDVEWKNRKAKRSGEPPVEPVYTMRDAQAAIKLFRGCAYDRIYQLGEGLAARFTDIGHLLGSAAIELWLDEGGVSKKIVFSGDVGNINQPIIKDPQTVEDADYLVIESTYGDRLHEKPKDSIEELADCLQTALDRGGSVIIPSFAVGRTQEMLYAIREIKTRGLLKNHDRFPVYIDSPLAQEATAIYMQCNPRYFDAETQKIIAQNINPIWFDGIELSTTKEESIAINSDERPKVIISASGMCEAGHIRHHLKHNLWKSENIILFVGYQAEGSLGRALLEGEKTVKLFGEEIAVSAEIRSLHGTSGHADRDGLIRWLSAFKTRPGKVFVNHGDEDSCEAFTRLLNERGYSAVAPYSGACFDLATGEALALPEGQRIERCGTARVSALYDALTAAAAELARLVKAFRGRSNRDTVKLTEAIRGVVRKFM